MAAILVLTCISQPEVLSIHEHVCPQVTGRGHMARCPPRTLVFPHSSCLVHLPVSGTSGAQQEHLEMMCWNPFAQHLFSEDGDKWYLIIKIACLYCPKFYLCNTSAQNGNQFKYHQNTQKKSISPKYPCSSTSVHLPRCKALRCVSFQPILPVHFHMILSIWYMVYMEIFTQKRL
jgi:hypothetical protein